MTTDLSNIMPKRAIDLIREVEDVIAADQLANGITLAEIQMALEYLAMLSGQRVEIAMEATMEAELTQEADPEAGEGWKKGGGE